MSEGNASISPAENRTQELEAQRVMEHAISSRDPEDVRRLLDEGIDPNIVISSSPLRSAVMYAAEEGCGDIVELLVEQGADLEVRDEDGMSALDLVDFYGDDYGIADRMLQLGAIRNPNLKTRQDELNEYYEARERLQSHYFDDRVFIYEVSHGTSESLLGAENRQTWAVIARRNVHRYPPVSITEFQTFAEADEFLRRVSPATPRVSLGHRPPDPSPSWDEYNAWVGGIEAAARENDVAVRKRRELAALLKWPKPRSYNKHGKRQRHVSSSPPCLQERALRAAVLRKLGKPRKGKRQMRMEPAQPMTRLVPAKLGRLRSELVRAHNIRMGFRDAQPRMRPLRRNLFTENPRRRLLRARLGIILLSQAHLVVSQAMKPRRTQGDDNG